MSLLLRPKNIIRVKDRWQNFTASGPFWEINIKLRKRSIKVLDGLVRKFAWIYEMCENTLKLLNIFAFNSVLLSFLDVGKLRAHILFTEEMCANWHVHFTWCMSENAPKIVF
jgi:hypothetical protein